MLINLDGLQKKTSSARLFLNNLKKSIVRNSKMQHEKKNVLAFLSSFNSISNRMRWGK